MRTRIAILLMFIATTAFADVRGKVTYPDGTPYAKASVTIRSGSGQSATVYTGTDGMFLHPGIPPGSYTLEVKTPNATRSQPIRVTAEQYTDVAPVTID